MPETGTITTYESGVNLVVEWKLPNFFTLSVSDAAYYVSPAFSFGGERWVLEIYPNGSSGRDSSGHVDLSLYKYSTGRSIRLTVSLSLKTAKGEKYKERHDTKDFLEIYPEYYHKLLRFIPRSELTIRKSDLVPEGVLTVVCTMRNTTSAKSDSNAASASAECRHCKGTFSADSLSSHRKKCMHRPTKCPDCLEVVSLEKWMNEHECQQERPEVSSIIQSEERDWVTDVLDFLIEGRGVDVTFEVETPNGKVEFFAHQLILALRSPYFADDFYGKGKNNGYLVIPLKGINPKAFKEMLRYCYDNKPRLATTEDARVLFKVASEFKLLGLQKTCRAFIRGAKIDSENVFSILKISEEMVDKGLEDMCYKILQVKIREVMANYDLCHVTPDMVRIILELPTLSLNSEYELIKWIFDWGKVKSEDGDSSSENVRDYLARLLKDLNFLALSSEEFSILCKDNPDFFSSDEMASIYQNISRPGTKSLPAWYDIDVKRRVYTESKK